MEHLANKFALTCNNTYCHASAVSESSASTLGGRERADGNWGYSPACPGGAMSEEGEARRGCEDGPMEEEGELIQELSTLSSSSSLPDHLRDSVKKSMKDKPCVMFLKVNEGLTTFVPQFKTIFRPRSPSGR